MNGKRNGVWGSGVLTSLGLWSLGLRSHGGREALEGVYIVVLDVNVISPISVRRVTVDAGYVMTVIKKVPIMDIISGLKKRIIPEQ